MGDIYGIHTMS